MKNKKYEQTIETLKLFRNKFFETYLKKEMNWWELYNEQILISDSIIEEAVKPLYWIQARDINVNISRQFWKSFIVFNTLVCLWLLLPDIFKLERWRLWIVINKQKQVKSNFDKIKKSLKKIIPDFWIEVEELNMMELKLSNWFEIVIFSMEAENNEWTTLNSCLVDEAQALNGKKYEIEIKPMMSTTWWKTIFVWVWWYKKNLFYENLIDEKNNCIFKYPASYLVQVVQKKYDETKQPVYLHYLNAVNEAKKSSDSYLTQYELEWMIEKWNFLKSLEMLSIFSEDYDFEVELEEKVYVWIDVAKNWDRTVVTVVKQTIDWKYKILNWYSFEEGWVNYVIQVKEILQFLKEYNVSKFYVDATWVWEAFSDILVQFLDDESKLVRIKFHEESKNRLWSNFLNILNFKKLIYPKNNKYTENFEKEMLLLEKEYTAKWSLKYHHPDKKWMHDDYVDSTFLALLALEENKNWDDYWWWSDTFFL